MNYKIDYIDSYVAFLDVLGFKEMVNNKNKKILNIYFEVINEVINDLKNKLSKRNLGYIVISDSIILTIPKSGNNNEDIKILRQLCVAISKIQKELAINNIWIRGAVTSGDTFFDQENNQIVGPAYINAYLLEEKLAKYPRVILDSNIINELKLDNSTQLIKKINDLFNKERVLYDWSKNVFVSKAKLDQDVPLFIDYLNRVLFDENLLNKTINNIKNNMYSNTNVYIKYRWIVDYLQTLMLQEDYNDLEPCINYKDELKKL